MSRIIIYTRGDPQFGMGHLHRVSWIVEALQAQPRISSGETGLLIRCHDTPAARSFWCGRPAPVEFINAPRITSELKARDVVVTDWLDSDWADLELLQQVGASSLLLEENGNAKYLANLVVNSLTAPLEDNSYPHGRAQVYEGASYLQFSPRLTKLRGVAQATTNALATELAAPLQAARDAEAGIGFVYLVMLSFGGGPRIALARVVLDALASTGFDQQAVLMPAGPDAADYFDQYPFSLSAQPAGNSFYEYLAGCDLLICAGGMTAYEAAFLGVPTLTVALNQQQLDTATKLAHSGCSHSTGLADSIDPAVLGNALRGLIHDHGLRSRMSGAGQSLTDGRGLMRTVELILGLLDG